MNYELSISLPTSWSELSQRQLRQVFMALAGVAPHQWMQAAARCVLRWGGFRIVCPYGRYYLISIRNAKRITRNATPPTLIMDTQEFTFACLTLEWMSTVPDTPMRIDSIDGAVAMPEDPTDVMTFEQWLACENYYQGYHATQDNSLLREMAAILYRKPDIRISPSEEISIFYWWAALKGLISDRFPNFFKPVSPQSAQPPTQDDILISVNSQIRALTRGDITKEAQILEMSAARALTELDAQAREYGELNKKFPPG